MKKINVVFRFFKSPLILLLGGLISAFFLFVYLRYSLSQFSEQTWVFSASMQTVATLIALLPISYGYYLSNIDNEKNEELDSYVITQLKKNAYIDMMIVLFYSLFVISLNLVAFYIKTDGTFSFVITYLTILSILFITTYIFKLFDPNKANDIIKEFDKPSKAISKTQISLDQFITSYLELETVVKDFITSKTDNELLGNTPLYDIVDLYSKDYPRIKEDYDTFKEIIFHRNNIIHNYSVVSIDSSKYDLIKTLIKKYQKYNNEFIQKNIFNNILTVKNKIEDAIEEVKNQVTTNESQKDLFISTLHTYFVSPYYESESDMQLVEVDFEVTQNNYSSNKLVGIEFRLLNGRNTTSQAKSILSRLSNNYKYFFIVFYNVKTNEYTVYYQTSDKQIKSFKK